MLHFSEGKIMSLKSAIVWSLAASLSAGLLHADPAPVAALNPVPPQRRRQKKEPFIAESRPFEAADQKQFPPENAVLFIGSSAFALDYGGEGFS